MFQTNIIETEMFQTIVAEKMKAHLLCSTTSFWKPCHWQDNVEKRDRARQATDDNITLCMHFACWITKATDTHSEYVILIAFPLQQRSHKCVSMSCYTNTASLD